jgi:hypothetical protein
MSVEDEKAESKRNDASADEIDGRKQSDRNMCKSKALAFTALN